MLSIDELMNRIHEAIGRMEDCGAQPKKIYIHKQYEKPALSNLFPYVVSYQVLMFDGVPAEFTSELPEWLDFTVVPKMTNRDKLIELFGKDIHANLMDADWWAREYEAPKEGNE